MTFNAERRSFGLYHLVRLRGSPRAWSEIRMVFAGSGGMNPSMIECAMLVVYAFIWRQWKSVDFGNFEVFVDFRA
jgi:hypothetical protein